MGKTKRGDFRYLDLCASRLHKGFLLGRSRGHRAIHVMGMVGREEGDSMEGLGT